MPPTTAPAQTSPNNGGAAPLPTFNPNAAFNNNVGPAPAPSPTMDASAISKGSSTTFQFPTNAPDAGTSASNASHVNASIPTPASIISQETVQTPAEQQNQSLLQKLAAAIGSKTSLASLQTRQESDSGVPLLTKSVNDLNAQLEGLNNQSTALANDAGQYGAIQNQERLKESGGNIEAAMSGRPMTKDALLQNNIKQASIASQALTVKSALYAAQGNLTLAKDAADKAGQVQFDAEQQQIDYVNALIDANKPQMNKEEKAQADLVSTQLVDRQTAINNAKEDKKTAIVLASTAMKNNPSDPQAQYAAQQVLQMNSDSPDYLQKVASLVGKYQEDPIATQQAIANLVKTRAESDPNSLENRYKQAQIDKVYSDMKIKSETVNAAGDTSTGLGQQLVDGLLAPSELSKRATGAGSYNAVLKAANAYSMATKGKPFDIAKADIKYKFANNVQTQNTLNYLVSLVGQNDGSGSLVGGNLNALIAQSDARSAAIASKKTIFGNTVYDTTHTSQLPALNNVTQWAKLQTGNPEIAAYYATITEVADQIAKVLQGGGSGNGTSDAKMHQALDLFQKGFTPAQISAVASSMKELLANRAKGIVGDNPYLSDYAEKLGVSNDAQSTNGTTLMVGPDGNQYNVPNDNVQKFKDSGGTVSFNSVGGDTNGASGIIGGYDITSYATDPTHEAKVSTLFNRISFVKTTQDMDKYIMSVAPNSPVTGADIMAAAQATSTPPALIMALMQQDSSFGTAGKAVRTRNPGNVGNTDSGATQSFPSWAAGVMAVAKNLQKRRVS